MATREINIYSPLFLDLEHRMVVPQGTSLFFTFSTQSSLGYGKKS